MHIVPGSLCLHSTVSWLLNYYIINHQIHIEACVLGKCSVGMKLRYSDE